MDDSNEGGYQRAEERLAHGQCRTPRVPLSGCGLMFGQIIAFWEEYVLNSCRLLAGTASPRRTKNGLLTTRGALQIPRTSISHRLSLFSHRPSPAVDGVLVNADGRSD